jgi:hypothetical protein
MRNVLCTKSAGVLGKDVSRHHCVGETKATETGRIAQAFWVPVGQDGLKTSSVFML